MSALRLLCCAAAVALCASLIAADRIDSDVLTAWTEFLHDYDRHYNDSAEARYRLNVFAHRLLIVREHNRIYEVGNHTYRMAMNQFADRTQSEVDVLSGFLPPPSNRSAADVFRVPSDTPPPPLALDWQVLGAVTPVQDQGTCGSCWAMAAVGAIEGMHYRQNHPLVALSVQQLVDCSTENLGCRGGWMVPSYEYVRTNGGIDTAASYPYENRDGPCRFNVATVGAKVSGYLVVQRE